QSRLWISTRQIMLRQDFLLTLRQMLWLLTVLYEAGPSFIWLTRRHRMFYRVTTSTRRISLGPWWLSWGWSSSHFQKKRLFREPAGSLRAHLFLPALASRSLPQLLTRKIGRGSFPHPAGLTWIDIRIELLNNLLDPS